MTNFVSLKFLYIFIFAVGTYSSSSAAQPTESKSPVLVHTKVDGNFAHYLESINGDIDGVVLEDGTLARFALFNFAPQPITLQPGDFVRIEGDRVDGMAGPYLVHALVTRINVPMTQRAIASHAPLGVDGNVARPRRGGKGALKENAQPLLAAGKPRGPFKARTGRVDDILAVDSASAHARKKGRLEIIESKAREATTGRGKGGNNVQWSRVEETAGP